jgi:2-amino-4-hydroxy-6-hydroxymethyldihydropteridine diphosphokinase
VKFIDWFPYYQDVRQQFGYSTEKDQQAAEILSNMIKRKALDIRVLQRKINGKQVMVIGAGPSLEKNVGYLKQSEYRRYVKLVANGAVQALIENKIKPDIVVTDLDGNLPFLRKAEKLGAIIVVHAHGDNIDLLKKVIPKLHRLIGTTQVMPTENVYNFGGFTDGDRCVFLAEEFKAQQIVLLGMEFGPHVGRYSKRTVEDIELKQRKMQAGKKLLAMLAKHSHSQLFDTSPRLVKGFRHFRMKEPKL